MGTRRFFRPWELDDDDDDDDDPLSSLARSS
jgi:hypothetical protein